MSLNKTGVRFLGAGRSTNVLLVGVSWVQVAQQMRGLITELSIPLVRCIESDRGLYSEVKQYLLHVKHLAQRPDPPLQVLVQEREASQIDQRPYDHKHIFPADAHVASSLPDKDLLREVQGARLRCEDDGYAPTLGSLREFESAVAC